MDIVETKKIRICGDSERRLMIKAGTFYEYVEQYVARYLPYTPRLVDEVMDTKAAHAYHRMSLRNAFALAKMRRTRVMLMVGEDEAIVTLSERSNFLTEGWTVICDYGYGAGRVFCHIRRKPADPRQKTVIRFGEF